MMRTPPRRRGLRTLERLEGRELLSTVAQPLGPEVAYAQFEPLTGRVLVQFTADPAGYDAAVLTDPANYRFHLEKSSATPPSKNPARPRAGVVLSPTYEVTGVTLANPLEPGVAPSVVVSINNNQPLKFGIFDFTIRSAGLVDLDGHPLDGRYAGTFPSGDARGGGDFDAILAEVNSTVLPALPTTHQAMPANPSGVAPSYEFLPTTRGVQVRYTSATPGRFMLAGGNKITLKPLAFQHFPGTYRLPALDASLIPRK